MIFPEQIRKTKGAKNLTQDDFGEKWGISPSACGQIERTTSNSIYNAFRKIAKGMDVSNLFLLDIGKKEFIDKTRYNLLPC